MSGAISIVVNHRDGYNFYRLGWIRVKHIHPRQSIHPHCSFLRPSISVNVRLSLSIPARPSPSRNKIDLKKLFKHVVY